MSKQQLENTQTYLHLHPHLILNLPQNVKNKDLYLTKNLKNLSENSSDNESEIHVIKR